jgi:hypothetical protein
LKRRADISAVLRMLRDCVDGVTYKATTHSIFVWHGKNVGILPKGPGVIKTAMVAKLSGYDVDYVKIRKLGQVLKIARDCFERHFPGLQRP